MVLEHLQRPDFTLEVCAEWLHTDLPSLCAFLTSDRGLSLLAHTELAQAIHIRAIAIAQLPRVIDAMAFALDDFANTCRNVPLNPKSMPALEFVERAKETARKNGQLLLRLAHFTPRPLRSYTQPAHSPSQREGAGGRASSTSNPTTPPPPPPHPQASTSPERERAVLPTHLPTHLPASTSPEGQQAGLPTTLFTPTPTPTPTRTPIPVQLTINQSAAPRQPRAPSTLTPPSSRSPPACRTGSATAPRACCAPRRTAAAIHP